MIEILLRNLSLNADLVFSQFYALPSFLQLFLLFRGEGSSIGPFWLSETSLNFNDKQEQKGSFLALDQQKTS